MSGSAVLDAQVTEGDGRMLVSAVGVHSEWGQTMALVVGEAADTPLQEKLTVLAGAIGKVGFAVALLCFVVLMIRCAAPAPCGSSDICCRSTHIACFTSISCAGGQRRSQCC